MKNKTNLNASKLLAFCALFVLPAMSGCLSDSGGLDTPAPVCTATQEIKDGVCVDIDTTECPPNTYYVLASDECVPIETTCTEGKTKNEAGECGCPTGKVDDGTGKCIDQPPPPPPAKVWVPSKVTTIEYKNDSPVGTVEYQLAFNESNQITTLTKSQIYAAPKPPTVSETITFTYNGQGKIGQIATSTANLPQTFDYFENGAIKTISTQFETETAICGYEYASLSETVLSGSIICQGTQLKPQTIFNNKGWPTNIDMFFRDFGTKSTFKYANDKLTEIQVSYFEQTSFEVMSIHSIIQYGTAGSATTALIQVAGSGGGSNYKIEATYDGGLLKEETVSKSTNGQWKKISVHKFDWSEKTAYSAAIPFAVDYVFPNHYDTLLLVDKPDLFFGKFNVAINPLELIGYLLK